MHERLSQVPEFTIEWIGDNDLEQISEISKEFFGSKSLHKHFIQHFMLMPDHIPMVMKYSNPPGIQDEVLGYVFYVLHEKFVLIAQLAIAKKHQRKGLGKQLLDHAKCLTKKYRRRLLAINVIEDNLPAQLFLKDSGFVYHRTVQHPDEERQSYTLKYQIPREEFP